MESLLWYATRGAGMVSLILLTAVGCLGMLTVGRWQRPGWPRFLTAEFHSNLALLSIVFLAIHILIAVLDPYTSLGLGAALVPFSSPYRQFWLGLGGVSTYMLAAIVVTSLLRARVGRRTWRAVHWLSYGAWPLAIMHSVGTGTDGGAAWGLLLVGGCVLVVVACLAWRIAATRGARAEIAAALPPRGVVS
jgi:methionine sulfoxide reductase heme-binding subunit